MDEAKTIAPRGAGALVAKGLGLQAQDYKVGDVYKYVIRSYGEVQRYFEDMVLQPSDRLVEMEVKSVKMVKKQEFIDANQE